MESLFATMERPDIAEIAARVAEWPGLRGCLIWTEASLAQAGRFPKGFNAGFVRERVALISESAIEVDASTGGSAVKGMTIHGAEHDFAIFRNGTAVICVLADDRDLPPGIRARLAQVARALTAIGR
jgi:predicted regulator of Ras-like GTPase activity (Roadblock/LC7/MglB family)